MVFHLHTHHLRHWQTLGLNFFTSMRGQYRKAPGQRIVAAQTTALLNAAAPTGPGATAPMGHSVGGGAGANNQEVALAPAIPETDPMKIALIPPTDITPEAAVVAYPKPIHTQTYPLNRYLQGALQSNVSRLYIDVEIFQL